MTNGRLVSVVIPARDAESHVAATVRGALEQDVEAVAVDVWVVDDGSVDRTGEAAREAGAQVLRMMPR